MHLSATQPPFHVCQCRALPSSLLLLSRAFTVTQPLAKAKGEDTEYESLKDTLSSLPKEVVDEIAMASPADGYGIASTLVSVYLTVFRTKAAFPRNLGKDVPRSSWVPCYARYPLRKAAPIQDPALRLL